MKAKNLGIVFVLLATIQVKGMEHMPPKILKMCQKNLPSRIFSHKDSDDYDRKNYDCHRLEEYFYCALNYNQEKHAKEYCSRIDINNTGPRAGLPSSWNLTHHIKTLVEERGKGSETPKEVVALLKNTEKSLLACAERKQKKPEK